MSDSISSTSPNSKTPSSNMTNNSPNSSNIPNQTASFGLVTWSLCHRELVRFFRQKNRVFGAFVQPIIFWFLFSEGFGSRENSELGYSHFYPGTLVMILLFTAIFSTISIIEDRREGFLQSVLVAPIPRTAMVLGKVFGGTFIAMIQGTIFMLLGWLTVKEVHPSLWHGFMAFGLMALLSVALTALGFLIAWRMESSQGFHAIMSVFLFPMWLLSGAMFPTGADGYLGYIVDLNPLTYGVSGLRYYLLEADSTLETGTQLTSLGLAWGVTFGFALLMLLASWIIAQTRTTADLH